MFFLLDCLFHEMIKLTDKENAIDVIYLNFQKAVTAVSLNFI